jgi:hypothetical protein
MAKLAGPVKTANAKLPKPNADSSGMVDLAALMAEQPDWLDEALAKAKGTKTVLPPPALHPIAPLSLGPMAVEIFSAPTLPAPPARRPLPLILASLGAGALVAAACVFALRLGKPAATPTSATNGTPVAAAAVEAPAAAAGAGGGVDNAAVISTAPAQNTPIVQQTASAPAAPAAAEAPDDDSQPATPTGAGGRHHHHGAMAREAREFPAPRPAPAAFLAKAAPAKAAPPASAAGKKPSPPASALEAALRSAAGPAGAAPPPVPAADSTPALAPAGRAAAAAPIAGRPDHPSGSAVTTTLTEVLSKVRACVTGTEPSHATVTFGSEGNVQGVSVTGPAGSDPAQVKCMKTAFGRAHVPPFSDPSYSAGITVRPR